MKKIIILGYGVVGKSVLNFLRKYKQNVCKYLDIPNFSVSIFEQKPKEPIVFSDHDNSSPIHVIDTQSVCVQTCIQEHDFVIPSPGFNLNEYDLCNKNIFCELDLFHHVFKKPVIAVTGTLGKTTVTTLLSGLARACDWSTHAGGNIGTAMLDLVVRDFDCLMLELSSFQLERSKTFAPDVAVWTNFSSNHLDRHPTLESYFEAKWKLFEYQQGQQHAIFSTQLLENSFFKKRIPQLKSQPCFVSTQESRPLEISCESYDLYDVINNVFRQRTVKHNRVVREVLVFDVSILPDSTYLQNWLLSLVALSKSGADLSFLQKKVAWSDFSTSYAHRLEQFQTINNVSFFNDSKSTVMQSTFAATQKLSLQQRPIIVIVGGLSKGVDRASFIASLQTMPYVKQVYCFGPECDSLGACLKRNTLNEVVDAIFATMQPGDVILFSPGGTSFDLFDNYQHRGNVFKELVSRRSRPV
ncbi:MAG: UDP-N-acetylmuramoyl-L-alanine--D-glutamate ligase [bacterium]